MAAVHPTLPEDGANIDPIFKLLNSKARSDEWNPTLAANLRSVLVNRQYTQLRCFLAGWVKHPKCIFCLHAAVTKTRHVAVMPPTAPTKTAGNPGGSPTPEPVTTARTAWPAADDTASHSFRDPPPRRSKPPTRPPPPCR